MNASSSYHPYSLNKPNSLPKVRISTSQGIRFVALHTIASIVSEAPYTYIHFTDGKKLFCSQSIKHFAERLRDFGFVRVHKSHIINVTAISLYIPECNGCVKLVNGQQVGFARGKKRLFMEVVEGGCL